MAGFNESTVEQAALAWLKGLGWQALHVLDIAPEPSNAEHEELDASGTER